MKDTIFTLNKKLSLKLLSMVGDGYCGDGCRPYNAKEDCQFCPGNKCNQLPSKGDKSTYCGGCVWGDGCYQDKDCCDPDVKCNMDKNKGYGSCQ